MKRQGMIWLSGLLALCFTVYIALDTFVLEQVYTDVPIAASTTAATTAATTETATETTGRSEAVTETMTEPTVIVTVAPGGTTAETAAETESVTETEVITETETETETEPALIITEDTYRDEHIQIQLTKYREYDSDIYVADVQLDQPGYLKTAFAKGNFGKNVIKTNSEMAQEVGAILSVNGDFYGAQEKGYVLKNALLYRQTGHSDKEDLAIYQDGRFAIVNEGTVTALDLLNSGVVNVLSFGPGLLVDGQISGSTTKDDPIVANRHNRTAVGWYGDYHYVFVVVDGRSHENHGVTLPQLAEFLQKMGVQYAYNLDGGGSSSMVFNGRVVNRPTANGKVYEEREVSDIVYIGY